MGVVLTNGRVVTPEGTYKQDIRIEDSIIESLGANIIKDNDRVIDVKGSYILPGGIDTHTHFDLDTGLTITADDFETGTKAGLVGGTTTILDFATQNKGETLVEALNNWHSKAYRKAYSDYGFHMTITDWNERTSREMLTMVEKGVTSFKMYMAYKGTLQVGDSEIYEALLRNKELGTLIGFHCENGDIISSLINTAKRKNQFSPYYHYKTRPECLEREAISRLTTLAEVTQSPVWVVHLSTKSGLIEAKKARDKGIEVILETCPQYLLLDKSYYGEESDKNF
jgi:dihydropyrimidinase